MSRPFCLLRIAVRNTSFTISVDRMFTISIRLAFTKARDAMRENHAAA
ncbi:hypothetical protein IC762_27225 [Bradyrhizobium genosp. L]|nr:hypothetical protein [Bradyrhizobium genosp. L]QPF83374.1 hypothetical protein IC762_27225 [Bradyrhizobium genosp. L]